MTSTQDNKSPLPHTHEEEEYIPYNAIFTRRAYQALDNMAKEKGVTIEKVLGEAISLSKWLNSFQMLQDLAKMKGVTMEEALSDAVSLSKWLNEERDNGGKVLIEGKNRKFREILAL